MSDVAGVSRAELEPRLARCVDLETPESMATADAIWAELAGRVWQGQNPYEGAPPWQTETGS